MKWFIISVVLIAFGCSSDDNNGNNQNNANNQNNGNNQNNSNNSNNGTTGFNNTNNMVDPNNMTGNTNQAVGDFLLEFAPLFCAYDQTCAAPDYADTAECETELGFVADEINPCDTLDVDESETCVLDLNMLMCAGDQDNYPEACDAAIIYEPCELECLDTEVFVTDRGDGVGGCFEPCVDNGCDGPGETCLEGGCAFIDCFEDIECPAPTTCDMDDNVCL